MSEGGLELELLSPVGVIRQKAIAGVPRLSDLLGKRIALYHNHKPNSSVCLEYLGQQLKDRVPGIQLHACGRGHESGAMSPEAVAAVREARVDGLVAAYGD